MIIDAMNRPREIGTVQIDTGNAKRFDITYTGADGKKEYPVILHTAVIGGIERYLYMVFDTAIKKKKETGLIQMPLWLNPEQVRILPISERHTAAAIKLAKKLERNSIRAGVDDSSETIGKKVREANQDWIGYVIGFGDKEMNGEPLNVYVREENKNRNITVKELVKEIKGKIKGKPFRPMYLPREMSRRPII